VARLQHPRTVDPGQKVRVRNYGSRVHVVDNQTQKSVLR